MKSVLQSFWLLTVAFGDLLVVILSSAKPVEGVVSGCFFQRALSHVIRRYWRRVSAKRAPSMTVVTETR